MVRIDPCHGSDPGSIPGSFVYFVLLFPIFFHFFPYFPIFFCFTSWISPIPSWSCGIMVRIDPCHGSDPGSIPGSFGFN